MPTTLKYLNDADLFGDKGKIIRIEQAKGRTTIILDETICYPQGGGQPADNGIISSENGIFTVSDVRMNEEGIVYHFGTFEKGTLQIGETVTIRIDEKRRILNAKLHSAAHLIDVAVEKIKLPIVAARKGYSFPDGPYVEYEGELTNPNEYIPILEAAVKELIALDIKVIVKYYSEEEAIVKGFSAPRGKTVRTISFEGYLEVGCGGTHVKSSKELGEIIIRKISSKKSITKICYQIK